MKNLIICALAMIAAFTVPNDFIALAFGGVAGYNLEGALEWIFDF